jgi:uncharacterized damage-inducible protein DinB
VNQTERPYADEYDPYYAAYIDRVQETDVIAALRQQQAETEATLVSLSDEIASLRYAANKWSVKEVVGHLCDTERVFAYRALCIARGEDQSLPGMDQDVYVAGAKFDLRTIDSLAEELAAIRSATIALFENLDQQGWKRSGIANEVSISVRAIAFIIAGHESHHMWILREKYGVGS